jgi:putative redox protein
VDEISREIILEGDLTDGERQRLLDIANRCPVHRTLTSEIKVRSKLANADGLPDTP